MKAAERKKRMSLFLIALGTICVLYSLGIFLFMGYGTYFFLIWPVIGSVLILWGIPAVRRKVLEWMPGWIKISAIVCVIAVMLLFVSVEGMILSGFFREPSPGADYCLILGAQMKSHGPSDVLRRRLDAAVRYLEDNPAAAVIVSGGQGANEPVSEAAGMYTYLVEKGIAPERILLEDVSQNTRENLEFSGKLIDPAKDRVVLVTNNFHMFRATAIAKKAGYAHAEGLAADSYPYMVPNNMLREFLGIVKDFCAGNL